MEGYASLMDNLGDDTDDLYDTTVNQKMTLENLDWCKEHGLVEYDRSAGWYTVTTGPGGGSEVLGLLLSVFCGQMQKEAPEGVDAEAKLAPVVSLANSVVRANVSFRLMQSGTAVDGQHR